MCVRVFWLQVPFVELHGESTKYVEQAEDAVIAASNYRLHIKFKESVVNVSGPGAGGVTADLLNQPFDHCLHHTPLRSSHVNFF